MDVILQKDLRIKIYDFFTRRVVYHSLFWFVVFMILILIESITSNNDFGFIFSNNIIRLGIFTGIVYFNLYYLIPNYLTRKKFLTYLILLTLSIIIITPLESIVFYFKFQDLPELQNQLVRDLNYSFLPNLFIGVSATIATIITDWVRHLREKQELQTQTMQSELRFLKSQINPHFLFNTLNNLYALTLKKSDKAPEIVIKLSEMMRYMLYECNERRVTLKKEVNYIRNYLDLEQLRQGKNVEINFDVKGRISEQQIAPLMFIPFLENSFKHGLNHTISEGYVNIFLNVDNNQVHFYIENSKPETLPKPTRQKSGGIGLVNVRRRLELMYPNKYNLDIENTPNSYGVNMELELD